MRFLLLISIFLCICEGASAQAVQQAVEQDSVPIVFNAVIEVSGQVISGIMVIKREENRCRVLFTTVAGPKLMDIYIDAVNYEILYVIKKLKKKVVLQLFQKDFALITGLYLAATYRDYGEGVRTVKLSKKKSVSYVFNQQKQIVRAEYLGKNKILVEVNYTYQSGRLDSIFLRHHNFNMKIRLNPIWD
ncbi:MAG: hypothetical protein LBR10_03075 [Prevotellaceae bacterium]|jgi:hypothetical protein|nr:hypothetical protein [Prevotellaceae bacterium]